MNIDSLLTDNLSEKNVEKGSGDGTQSRMHPQLERLNSEYIKENENSSIGNISEDGSGNGDFDVDSEFTLQVEQMSKRQTNHGKKFEPNSPTRRQSAHARMMSPSMLDQLKSQFGGKD